MSDEEARGCFGCLLFVLAAGLIIFTAGWLTFFGVLILVELSTWKAK